MKKTTRMTQHQTEAVENIERAINELPTLLLEVCRDKRLEQWAQLQTEKALKIFQIWGFESKLTLEKGQVSEEFLSQLQLMRGLPKILEEDFEWYSHSQEIIEAKNTITLSSINLYQDLSS